MLRSLPATSEPVSEDPGYLADILRHWPDPRIIPHLGTNVPAQNDASGFTGPDPSGTTQSGAGQASGGVPDLTGEQGGATGPGSASDTGKSSGGVLHKVKRESSRIQASAQVSTACAALRQRSRIRRGLRDSRRGWQPEED